MITINFCYQWSRINKICKCWPLLNVRPPVFICHCCLWNVQKLSWQLKGSIYHHVPYSVSYFIQMPPTISALRDTPCSRRAFPVTYSSKKNKCYYQLWDESFKKLWAEWAPGVSDRGYLCSSIKGWAVIKAHFYLNECKLAHLLWWSSCPDSSISMIDQLSSCWWLIGNGGWEMGWRGV